jgi:hypothetical protein
MFRRRFFLVLGLILAMAASPSANAGTMILDSFVDQSPDPINLPATKLLMATVNTTGDKGGNDASATTVTIGGSVAAADVVEITARGLCQTGIVRFDRSPTQSVTSIEVAQPLVGAWG